MVRGCIYVNEDTFILAQHAREDRPEREPEQGKRRDRRGFGSAPRRAEGHAPGLGVRRGIAVRVVDGGLLAEGLLAVGTVGGAAVGGVIGNQIKR